MFHSVLIAHRFHTIAPHLGHLTGTTDMISLTRSCIPSRAKKRRKRRRRRIQVPQPRLPKLLRRTQKAKLFGRQRPHIVARSLLAVCPTAALSLPPHLTCTIHLPQPTPTRQTWDKVEACLRLQIGECWPGMSRVRRDGMTWRVGNGGRASLKR
jgi:hypothetical protein